MNVLNNLLDLMLDTGFFYVDWRMCVMWVVIAILFYLAVAKEFEPLLLIPIAFGGLLANLPTQGVVNKPAGSIYSPASGTVSYVFVEKGQDVKLPRTLKDMPDGLWRVVKDQDNGVSAEKDIQEFLNMVSVATNHLKAEDEETVKGVEMRVHRASMGVPNLVAIVEPKSNISPIINLEGMNAEQQKEYSKLNWKDKYFDVKFMGKDLRVRPSDDLIWAQASGMVTDVPVKNGEAVVYGQKLAEFYSPHSGGLYYYIQQGILLELFPPLIFLGVGALTDFGPLIANPRTLLLGAAAQFGVFFTFIGALLLGFTSPQAASIGIIGGADGPTSIFLTNKLAPDLLAPIAVSAYSYMALVPVIQPPIMRLLTTSKERKIRMKTLRKVSRLEKLIFAMVVTIFCVLLVPDASALIGMLMLGNFIRECGVTERLNKASQNELINLVTIFLGTSVGITMTGDKFLRVDTLCILALGVVAFIVATAAGIIIAKIMNLFSPNNKVNPLIGSAGVSAVPMAARVSHVEGQKADPSNYLIMHAMGPNVAGVIGTAMVAGFFIKTLASSGGH